MKKFLALIIVLLSMSCNKKTPYVEPKEAEGVVSLEFNGQKMVFDLFYAGNYVDENGVQSVKISCRNTKQDALSTSDYIEYIVFFFKQDAEASDFYLYDCQLGRRKSGQRLAYTSIINPENKITVIYKPEIQQQFRMKGTFYGTLDLASPFERPNDKVVEIKNGILDLNILRRV